MRTQTNTYGTFNYPDKWCFASNSQRIEVQSTILSGSYNIVVSDTTNPTNPYEFEICLYNGKANIELSRIFEAMLEASLTERTKYVHVAFGNSSAHILSFHCYVLRGKVELGEYFASFHAFSLEEGQTEYTHRVRWFKHYPFKVSFFRRGASETITRSVDGATAENVLTDEINYVDVDLPTIAPAAKRKVQLTHTKSSSTLAVFDKTFDNTFVERYGSMVTEIVDIEIDDHTEGYYLRWTDTFGQLRYFLFAKGETKVTSKSSSYEIPDSVKGYNLTRALSKTITETRTASAMYLPMDILDYVKTVASSPYVELYDDGKWLPVRVETSETISSKDKLQNVEITINIDRLVQNLI